MIYKTQIYILFIKFFGEKFRVNCAYNYLNAESTSMYLQNNTPMYFSADLSPRFPEN